MVATHTPDRRTAREQAAMRHQFRTSTHRATAPGQPGRQAVLGGPLQPVPLATHRGVERLRDRHTEKEGHGHTTAVHRLRGQGHKLHSHERGDTRALKGLKTPPHTHCRHAATRPGTTWGWTQRVSPRGNAWVACTLRPLAPTPRHGSAATCCARAPQHRGEQGTMAPRHQPGS